MRRGNTKGEYESGESSQAYEGVVSKKLPLLAGVPVQSPVSLCYTIISWRIQARIHGKTPHSPNKDRETARAEHRVYSMKQFLNPCLTCAKI